MKYGAKPGGKMPIHYRNPCDKYEVIPFDEMERSVRDAEFMLQSYRKGMISKTFIRGFSAQYTSSMIGMSNKTLNEVFSDDPQVRSEAERLIDRNEHILEYLDALKLAAIYTSEERLKTNSTEGEFWLQAEVEHRLETDPDKAVYYPLPSLD